MSIRAKLAAQKPTFMTSFFHEKGPVDLNENQTEYSLLENNMISKIRYVSITVTDIDTALDFYVTQLNFKLLVQMPLPGGNQFVMVAPPDSGSNLVFSLPLPGRTHTPSFSISFETEDVQSTFEELVAKGVTFSRPPSKTPWGGIEAAFVDPFGNNFLLQQGGL